MTRVDPGVILPPEILATILTFLATDRSSLKACCQMNRHWSYCVRPILFARIRASDYNSSSSSFLAIARTNHLAELVKEVVYDCAPMPISGYESCNKHLIDCNSVYDHKHADGAETACTQRLRSIQRYISTDDSATATALGLLPRLHSLELCGHDSRTLSAKFMEALHTQDSRDYDIVLDDTYDREIRLARIFAASISNTSLQYVSLGLPRDVGNMIDLSHESSICLSTFVDHVSWPERAAVKEIRLGLKASEGGKIFWNDPLRSLLRACRGTLETLSIVLVFDEYKDQHLADFSPAEIEELGCEAFSITFLPHRFARMRHLTLVGWTILEADLNHFQRNHPDAVIDTRGCTLVELLNMNAD